MTGPSTTAPPYPPSILHRLFAAIERLPGGGWWVYPLMLVALAAYHWATLWIIGGRPVGSFPLDGIPGLAFGPYTMAACHYFTRVSASSMEAFRPASGASDAVYARRRYELVTMSASASTVAFAIGSIVGVGTILFATREAIAPYGDTPMQALVVFGPAAVFGYGMSAVAIYETVRQLRMVDRLHREATALDLFDAAPLYAFSRLTVRIGVAYVFASYYALIVNAAFQAGNTVSLAVIAGSIVVGIACFILPLWGIHGRLSDAKTELVRGVNLRARALEDVLYRRVDTSELVGVKDVTDALAGIRAARDDIDRLPTWPWPPHVLRGFISAIILPVIVYMVTRYIGLQIV